MFTAKTCTDNLVRRLQTHVSAFGPMGIRCPLLPLLSTQLFPEQRILVEKKPCRCIIAVYTIHNFVNKAMHRYNSCVQDSQVHENSRFHFV